MFHGKTDNFDSNSYRMLYSMYWLYVVFRDVHVLHVFENNILKGKKSSAS